MTLPERWILWIRGREHVEPRTAMINNFPRATGKKTSFAQISERNRVAESSRQKIETREDRPASNWECGEIRDEKCMLNESKTLVVTLADPGKCASELLLVAELFAVHVALTESLALQARSTAQIAKCGWALRGATFFKGQEQSS